MAGLNCRPLQDLYRVSYGIFCNTTSSTSDIQGQIAVNIKGVSATYINSWRYVRTSVSSFFPLRGPESGGTAIRVTGQNLNAGTTAKITVAEKACVITER